MSTFWVSTIILFISTPLYAEVPPSALRDIQTRHDAAVAHAADVYWQALANIDNRMISQIKDVPGMSNDEALMAAWRGALARLDKEVDYAKRHVLPMSLEQARAIPIIAATDNANGWKIIKGMTLDEVLAVFKTREAYFHKNLNDTAGITEDTRRSDGSRVIIWQSSAGGGTLVTTVICNFAPDGKSMTGFTEQEERAAGVR